MMLMMKIDNLNSCSQWSLIHQKIKKMIKMKDKLFQKKEILLITKEAKIT